MGGELTEISVVMMSGHFYWEHKFHLHRDGYKRSQARFPKRARRASLDPLSYCVKMQKELGSCLDTLYEILLVSRNRPIPVRDQLSFLFRYMTIDTNQ